MVIQDPHLDGDTLTYSIELLDGTVPATTGPCALFIDPFGRPLSPSRQPGCTSGSVAGAEWPGVRRAGLPVSAYPRGR